MKLFKYENFKLNIAEEAFLLKPFKIIWNRDKTIYKERALAELGYIYFLCDPRSDYMFLTDEEERSAKIIEQEGLKSSWKPDKIVQDGIALYKYLTQTTSSLLLEDTRIAIEKLRTELKTLSLTAVDDKGKLLYPLSSYTALIRQIPELSVNLMEAEKALYKELAESSKMRGQGVKKLLEDGFKLGGRNEEYNTGDNPID